VVFLNHQYVVYKTAKMRMIMVDPMANPGVTRNIRASMTIELSGCRRSARLIKTMTAIMNANVIDMRSRNGKSGNTPPVHAGRNLSMVEIGIVNNVPASAALGVVLLQKNPSRKMASTPGEMNPTYS